VTGQRISKVIKLIMWGELKHEKRKLLHIVKIALVEDG
jgi:hypothetical protein